MGFEQPGMNRRAQEHGRRFLAVGTLQIGLKVSRRTQDFLEAGHRDARAVSVIHLVRNIGAAVQLPEDIQK